MEEEEQQQQEERPRGGDIPLQIIPTPAQPEKEDITVERSDKVSHRTSEACVLLFVFTSTRIQHLTQETSVNSYFCGL